MINTGICKTYFLLLPTDSLKTPDLSYKQKTVNFTYDIPIKNSNPSYVESFQNKLTASFVVLFFRYSEQSTIPLFLSSGNNWQRELSQANFSVSNKSLFSEIIEQLEIFLLPKSTNSQLSLSELDANTQGLKVVIHWQDSSDSPIVQNNIKNSSLVEKQNDFSKFDLYLGCHQKRGQLKITCVFNELLFSRNRLSRMLEHWHNIMVKVGDSDSLGQIDFLSVSDKETIAAVQNIKFSQYADYPIHYEIEKHAIERPNKEAVVYENQSLTYMQLNQACNRLAHWLNSNLSNKKKRVLVILEPGLHIPIVLLAIFKAGATYVPFDPEFPALRLKQIIDDVEPQVVITQIMHKASIPSGDYQMIAIDDFTRDLSQFPSENLQLNVGLEQTAYIYYTSGTTGKPKGILASHANLIQYIFSANRTYGFNIDSVLPAVARFTFSISMFELMSPLFAGGKLLLMPRNEILDPVKLLKTLRQINVLHMGPSLLKGLIKYIHENVVDFAAFDHINHVSSGGDMIPPELLEKLRKIFRKAELFVIYGCSEISCMGTTWRIPENGGIDKTLVGSTFLNMHTIIIDSNNNLVPEGIPGNVCFAGNGLVKGYLNLPDLTNEKFFLWQGKRFYFTGDRGRIDQYGNLELLGRLDFQIQLHGMRIELGELEYHLRQSKGVMDGIVVCRELNSEDKVLVAYYVVDQLNEVSIEKIKDEMSSRLPSYMVPSLYQQLSKMPLNQNMKIDRKALPDFKIQRGNSGQLPQSDIESFIANWWSKRFNVYPIYLNDNFFDLGGDSVSAMDLILDLEKKYSITLNGLEIVRESLEILAKLISGESVADNLVQMEIAKDTLNISPEFFGSNKELFGVFHPVKHGLEHTPKTSVLICPPIGHEHIRTYHFIRVLAERLAKEGFPCFRFDYYATGDSYGRDLEVDLSRWTEDQNKALERLKELVPQAESIVIAARLGATIALTQTPEKQTNKLIVWDPIFDGMKFYDELTGMHQRKILSLLRIKGPFFRMDSDNFEQLLGFRFSSCLLEDLKALRIKQAHVDNFPAARWLLSDSINNSHRALIPENQLNTMKTSCDWSHEKLINKGFIDQNIENVLLSLVKESTV